MIDWVDNAAIDDFGRHLVIVQRDGVLDLLCDKHRVGVFHHIDVAKLCAQMLHPDWQPARDPRLQHTGFKEPR